MDKNIPIRIALVEEAIAKAAQVSIEDMRGRSREKAYSEARQAVWYIAHDHIGFSFPFLAALYDRDHTTIMHGVQKIRKSERIAEKIIEGIRSNCPQALEKTLPGEPRTVDDWRF